MIKLRHHYWDVRGRAQVLRYMLEQIAYQHKDVEYREEFEPIETAFTTWSQRKCDPTVSGPYRVLPVLHWNEKDTFGETLAIGSNISFCFSSSKLNFRLFSAHLLARKFDFYGKPTSNYSDSILLESYLNGVASSAYTDVIANILTCIWHSTTFELENNPQAYTVQRIRDTLDAFNVLLKQSSTSFFYDQLEPTIADYFVFEAYTVTRDVHAKFLPTTNCDALEKLENIIKQRPAMKEYFQGGRLLKRFTAAPHEDEYLKKLSKLN